MQFDPRKALVLHLVVSFVLALAGCGSDGGSQQRSEAVEAVFIGSSQTSDWILSQSFPGRNFVKKAVLSDTSADMLARFQRDVIDVKPKVVLIWAGENDVDRRLPLATSQANITAMRQMAADASIRVVLGTVPPKGGSDAFQNPTIVNLNAWIRSYGTSSGTSVADFYAVLVGPSGEIKAEFANGTEHLSDSAYAAITPVASAAITHAEQK